MKKWIERVKRLEELCIGYALLLIACIATIQVFLRYTFGICYDWVDEGSRYMTILITFVGAGICALNDSHFSMDALVQYLPRRGKHLLRALAMFISSLVMAVVFYYSWIQIAKLYKFGATTPSLRLPMYVPYLPIGIFSLVIALTFFYKGCTRLIAVCSRGGSKQEAMEDNAL